MNWPIPAAIALVIAFSAACGADTRSSSEPSKASQDSGKSHGDPLVDPYIRIQETLADDSIDHLAELGAQLVAGSETLQEKPGIAEVLIGAGRIASPDIETARLAFQKMSMGLIAYLKATPAARADLQVIHCPMAFNNKGAYWVQSTGDVQNPYHGKMMLRCGDPVSWKKSPG